jgi:DNA topoisomerase I
LQSKKRKTQTQDSDDSDVPLARKGSTVTKAPKVSPDEVKKLGKKKKEIEKKAERVAKEERTKDAKKRKVMDSDSDDDIPLAKKKVSTNGIKTPASDKKQKVKVIEESTPKKSKAKAKPETSEDDKEDDDTYRWWEEVGKGDGTIKWNTLEHSGVIFPPAYEPLPKKVKLIYNGEPVRLHPDAEEVATFYGAMLHSTVNVENPTFNKNFFDDFKQVLDKTGHAKNAAGEVIIIKSFEKCNFNDIFEHFEREREKKRVLPVAEKKAIKAAKDEAEAAYLFCTWDGRKQKVGNFRVEPPGLFRGRGEHPKTGRVKLRVRPEQITINVGKEARVPEPPPGTRWKEVKHDQCGTWLAMWNENINGAYKYVMLAANSDIKGQSDYKKFEKARELKKYIDKIRRDYTRDLKSGSTADRQLATAVYLIDKLALRAGNEKGEDEADTVGCCSLKFEHITLTPPNSVTFDFLGKDSIRYHDTVTVDAQVFKNLRIFKKPPKGKGDEVFDRLTTSGLNKHLSSYMTGLTAKVFRTYNASFTMASLLKELKAKGTIAEKISAYNDANRKVAILCNHKRTVGAAHETQMEKLQDRINALRYQQWRVRMQMLDVDPKLKKKRGAEYFERPEDLTDEVVAKLQEIEINEKRDKARKKFQKDNDSLVAEGKKLQSEKVLQELEEDADELAAKYKKENKTGKVPAEGKSPSVEKLEAQYEKLTERIDSQELAAKMKEDNKEVALGTSKIVSFPSSLD